MAITIKDVADAAGVSTATVSRALRGLPNVDTMTRQRIQKIATDLDYVISPSASRLASGRTGCIGVITPHIAFNSREAFLRILQTTVANVEAYLAGQPQNLISPR